MKQHLSILLSLCLMLTAVLTAPTAFAIDEKEMIETAFSSVSGSLTTIDGEIVSLAPKNPCRLHIIIFGAPETRTRAVLDEISSAKLSMDGSYRFIYADIIGNSMETISDLKNDYPNGISYCSGDNYDTMKLMPNGLCDVVYPLIAYIAQDGTIRKTTQGIQSLETIQGTVARILNNTEESGSTGDCTWTLDNNGNFRLSGSGETEDFGCYSPPPWGYEFTRLTVDDGVKKIGDRAFNEAALKSVSFPESLTHIGLNAFAGCNLLLSVTFPENLLTIEDGAFQTCYDLKSITLPKNLTYLGEYAFANCTDFDRIEIPQKINEIKDMLFINCRSLKKIGLPKGVKKIGFAAFSGCDSLSDIYFEGSETDWKKLEISDINEPFQNATVHFNSSLPQEDEVILGDADSDGDVTIFDATAIQRYLAELSVTDFDDAAADADGDGDVTIFDATAIQRYLADLPTSAGIGEPIG